MKRDRWRKILYTVVATTTFAILVAAVVGEPHRAIALLSIISIFCSCIIALLTVWSAQGLERKRFDRAVLPLLGRLLPARLEKEDLGDLLETVAAWRASPEGLTWLRRLSVLAQASRMVLNGLVEYVVQVLSPAKER